MAGKVRIGGMFFDLGARTAKLDKALAQSGKKLRKFGRDSKRTGKELTAALSLPLAAVGLAAVKSAMAIEDAMATIRTGTGKTGTALKGLEKDFRTVFSKVPESSKQVSMAIADLNTRLGLSGKPLQDLATQTLELSRITKSDLGPTIRNTTRVFGDWGVANKDAGKTLDLLFKTSQQTGIGVDALSTKLVQFGAPLRALGFDLKKSAALMGKWEKEGVNMEAIFSGMKMGLGKLMGKFGVKDLGGAFEYLSKQMKEAKTDAEAGAIAFEMFGSRAAVDMAMAVREGRFEVSAFLKELEASPETIKKAAEASLTFSQRLKILRNNAALALEPFGAQILRDITPILLNITAVVRVLGEAFAKLPDAVRTSVSVFVALVAIAGPVKLAIGAVALAFSALFSVSGLVLTGVGILVSGLIGFKDEIITFGSSISKFFKQLSRDIFVSQMVIKNYFLLWKTNPLMGNKFQTAVKMTAQGLKNLERALGKDNLYDFDDGMSGLADTLNKAEIGLNKVKEEIGELAVQLKSGNLSAEDQKKLFDAMNKGAGDATKSVEALSNRLKELDQQIAQDDIGKQIEQAIKNLDTAALSGLLEKFRTQTKKGVLAGLDAAVRDSEAAQEYANKVADRQVDAINTRIQDALTAAHKESVQAWESMFENAITGVRFSLKDMFGQLAVGFAAQLAQGIAEAFGYNGGAGKSPKELGSQLGGLIFSKDRPAGVQGPLQKDGSFFPGMGQFKIPSMDELIGVGESVGMSVAINNVIDGFSRLGKSSEETAKGIGELGGTAIGAYFGGPIGAAVGGKIGKSLGRLVGKLFEDNIDPQQQARIDAFDRLNETLKKFGGITYFKDGKAVTLEKLELGDYKKIGAGDAWADKAFKDFGTEATLGAAAIGDVFEELLGLTENVGAQIGIALLDNVGGSIDGLRALVQGLGLDFETVQEQLVNLGKTGELSWHEVEVGIRHSVDAFKEGLKDTGAFTQALKNLLATEGRGIAALTQLKNIAVEAQEANIETLEDLRKRLEASGEFTQQEIDALFYGFSERGIKTFEDLLEASDRTLGGIVADMDSFFQDNGNGWKKLSEEIDGFRDSLDYINGMHVTPRITLDISKEDREALDALNNQNTPSGGDSGGHINESAYGGILGGRTFVSPGRIAGEHGPEAILPLKSVNGRLGVSQVGGNSPGGLTINIDARGAGAGVEGEIIAAIEEAKGELLADTIDAVVSYQNRGVFRGTF